MPVSTGHVAMRTRVQDMSTGHVAMRIRVQDWTRVRILTGPVITDHWTEAPPLIYSLVKSDTSHMSHLYWLIS